MKSVRLWLLALLLPVLGAAAAHAGEASPAPTAAPKSTPPAKPTATPKATPSATPAVVLQDREFTILTTEKGETIGSRYLRVAREAGQLVFTEDFRMKYRGHEAGWRSRVVYTDAATPVPVEATAQTLVDEAVCLDLAVSCGAQELTVTGRQLCSQEGEPLDAPQKIADRHPRPAGPLCFLPATLAFLGPRLLPRAGELTLTVADFPDDIDGPINVKDDRRLVREDAADGTFTLRLLEEQRTDPVVVLTYDKQGACTGEAWENVRMVPQ